MNEAGPVTPEPAESLLVVLRTPLLLILLGLFTSWAAFIASGMMAVTYWWKHAFNGQFWNPLSNGGEAAVLFCFAFLYLWLRGAGTYSLDEKLR